MKISDLSGNREFLESLVAGGSVLPEGVDAFAFCVELLPNLGSTDPVLRDDLSANILDTFVSDPGRIIDEQARHILSVCLDDDHLFLGIGEKDTDSVFMRSFSALISSSIIYRDSLAHTPGTQSIREGICRLLRYATLERDFRGYVQGKGWAHSIAHLSDALFASAGHPAVDRQHLVRILDTTAAISRYDCPMSNWEPGRLAYAAARTVSMMGDGPEALEWIGSYKVPEDGGDRLYARHNSAAFLRDLYFDLRWEKADPALLEAVEEKLRGMDPLYGNRDVE